MSIDENEDIVALLRKQLEHFQNSGEGTYLHEWVTPEMIQLAIDEIERLRQR
jgi:hypothetical protein